MRTYESITVCGCLFVPCLNRKRPGEGKKTMGRKKLGRKEREKESERNRGKEENDGE